MAVAQREVEDRVKQPGESFHQYFLSKLKVLSSAFPESLPATHISRVRAKFNDAQVNRYIRERNNIAMFGEECHKYDEHIKLHPRASLYRGFQYPPSTAATTSTPQPLPAWKLLVFPSKPVRDRGKREAAKAYRARIDARTRSIADHVDPATNKRTRSFLRKDGSIKFIEWPCKLCSKIGKKHV